MESSEKNLEIIPRSSNEKKKKILSRWKEKDWLFHWASLFWDILFGSLHILVEMTVV